MESPIEGSVDMSTLITFVRIVHHRFMLECADAAFIGGLDTLVTSRRDSAGYAETTFTTVGHRRAVQAIGLQLDDLLDRHAPAHWRYGAIPDHSEASARVEMHPGTPEWRPATSRHSIAWSGWIRGTFIGMIDELPGRGFVASSRRDRELGTFPTRDAAVRSFLF